jgi:hypothetical protein
MRSDVQEKCTENEHTLTDEEIDAELEKVCCRKCFGRGYIGWTLSNDPVLCDCTRRAKKTLPLEAKSNE